MKIFITFAGVLLFFAQIASAQNLIQDGGFDGAPQSGFGNRGSQELSPWYFGGVTPYHVLVNDHNLVAVDGAGGFDYSNLGPESDASGVGAGVAQYYLDSGSITQLAWQYFTPTCSGTATATALFTNREDHGRAEGTITGPAAPSANAIGSFLSTEGGLSILAMSSQIPPFATGFAVAQPTTAQMVQDMNSRHQAEEFRFVLGAVPTQTSPWVPISHQVPVQSGQLYAFVAELGHSVNMDNVSVVLDCDSGSTTTGTQDTAEPRVASVKTCDPVAVTATGGYRMDCMIDVTASGLTADGFVVVADGFSALAPVTATITGPMMTVTSNEAWRCVDAQINAPASMGVCELPAADMIAAGGQSTLNVRFDFTADATKGQVVNCPFSQASDTSYVAGLGQKNRMDARMDAMGGLQKSDALPDGCVVLDLPAKPVDKPVFSPAKDVAVKKSCDADPYATQVNGQTGIGWQCEITVIASPAPFAGSFSFVEDAAGIVGAPNGGIVAMAPRPIYQRYAWIA